MKRLLIIIVVVSLLLCGCGKKEEKEEPQRFIIEYEQYFNWSERISIIRDTETGDSYILVRSGAGVGLLEVDNG